MLPALLPRGIGDTWRACLRAAVLLLLARAHGLGTVAVHLAGAPPFQDRVGLPLDFLILHGIALLQLDSMFGGANLNARGPFFARPVRAGCFTQQF